MDRFPAVTQGCLYGSTAGDADGKLRSLENYRGILEYTGERILLQAKTCQVCLEGTRLSIDYYTNEDMKISGNISALRYLRE